LLTIRPESSSTNDRYPVLGQDQGLEAEEVSERLLLHLNDGVVVQPEPHQGGQVPEGALLHDGQVVAAQVQVLELRHVGEGAPDLVAALSNSLTVSLTAGQIS
jgi:hypothetical protein